MLKGWKIVGLILSLTAAAGAELAWPAVYRCEDSSGAKVFTDNPAQLKSCMVLPSSLPPASMPTERPPAGSSNPAPVGRPDLPVPPAAPAAPASPQAIPPPDEHQPRMEVGPGSPATGTPPPTQACPPALNPLNPFAGCPPASSPPPSPAPGTMRGALPLGTSPSPITGGGMSP
jgi:hypothetical protein